MSRSGLSCHVRNIRQVGNLQDWLQQEGIHMKRILMAAVVVFGWGLAFLPLTVSAQQALVIKSLAEKKVADLPAGPLFWRIEHSNSLAQAQDAAGAWSC